MTLGITTIKIQRSRIAYLTAELSRLRRENERLRHACEVLGYEPLPEPPTTEGISKEDWDNPAGGMDLWDIHPHTEGAD